jgi:transposase
MAARFQPVNRDAPMLLPPDMRDWIPEDDLVHFVIEAVERLPLKSFKVNNRGTGSAQMHPHMMLALLVYSYANGIFSSLKIERATHRDIGVRYITGDNHPDHDTICTFRRENFPAITEAFVDLLELAKSLGLLKLGQVSTDGTHIKASAAMDQNISYQRAQTLRTQLTLDIKELLEKAEQADEIGEDPQALPEEISRLEKLKAKMDKACAELEKRAEKRREEAQKAYDAKVAARLKRAKEGKPMTGSDPKPPKSAKEFAEQSKETMNLTDPDSRVMRKSARSAYTQSLNCQISVDADGSSLIVGKHVTQSSGDINELEPAIRVIPESLGQPTRVLADAGYLKGTAITSLQDKGIEVYCSAHREDAHDDRKYDYRPAKKGSKEVREFRDPDLIAMREKLSTPDGKAIYKQRARTVEPVFGIIKEAMGFRGFMLRGFEKMSGEWALITHACNIKRLHTLMRTPNPS